MLPKKKQTIEQLLQKVSEYTLKGDVEIIRLAYDFAKEAHHGQTRKSGEPYIEHPLATAHILANMRIDPVIVIAALLHDVPEDTDVTLDEIEKNFGPDVASL